MCCRLQLKQLLAYVNRYGPGMVIYWSGYVESLNDPQRKFFHPEIHVASQFPEDTADIMLCPGSISGAELAVN